MRRLPPIITRPGPPAPHTTPSRSLAGTGLSSTPQILVQPRSPPAVPAGRMSSKEADSRMSVEQQIAQLSATEIAAKATQVVAAIGLLDEGATVPFIARYRKEVTGGLDDTQLRTLEERLGYLRELESRRETVLDSIRSQGKLTDELQAQIAAVMTKAELEDLYLPYKQKRRKRPEPARELAKASRGKRGGQ